MNNPEPTNKGIVDIINLKAQWRRDPSWDIEDTKGFEAWHDELLAWRMAEQAAFMSDEDERLERKAAVLHCSVELVGYIEILERRIKALEDKQA